MQHRIVHRRVPWLVSQDRQRWIMRLIIFISMPCVLAVSLGLVDMCPEKTHAVPVAHTAILDEAKKHAASLDDLKSRHPMKGLGMPGDIARMAVVLASEDANWVTGVCLPVDGGYTAR